MFAAGSTRGECYLLIYGRANCRARLSCLTFFAVIFSRSSQETFEISFGSSLFFGSPMFTVESWREKNRVLLKELTDLRFCRLKSSTPASQCFESFVWVLSDPSVYSNLSSIWLGRQSVSSYLRLRNGLMAQEKEEMMHRVTAPWGSSRIDPYSLVCCIRHLL